MDTGFTANSYIYYLNGLQSVVPSICSFLELSSICTYKRTRERGCFVLSSVIFISIMVALIILLLFVGAPIKPMRFIGQTTVKLGIGILFLFFLNVFGGAMGLHVPINLFTVAISGFLGLFGVASLTAIHWFLIF